MKHDGATVKSEKMVVTEAEKSELQYINQGYWKITIKAENKNDKEMQRGYKKTIVQKCTSTHGHKYNYV